MIESTAAHRFERRDVVAELRRAQLLRDGQSREARRRHVGRRARARPRPQSSSVSASAYFQQDRCRATCDFFPKPSSSRASCPPDLPPDTLYVFCDMSDRRRAGEYSAAGRARERARHRPSSRQRALRQAELRARDGVLDRDRRHAPAARARRAARPRHCDLHPRDDHDRHRRVHALEHDARGARARRRADAPAVPTKRRSPKRSSCASASRRRSCWAAS